MELRQIEAFVAVMSVGSITGAARLLNRSQPAVTRLVQELEAEIGYALFTRHGPRVTPTAQALLFYEDAERALNSLRQVHARAADIARGDGQPLRLAATSALAVGLLPQALQQIKAKLGATPIQLRSASPEHVVHSVLTGAVQLGACSLPLEHRGLLVHWIAQLPCVAVLAQGDPLTDLPRVPLASLAKRRLITLSNPFRLRHQLNAVLGSQQQCSEGLIETNASINAQALVRAGLGVAVLEPLTALGAPLDGVVVRPLDVNIPFFFGVITPQLQPLTETLSALINALRDAAMAMSGAQQHDVTDHASLLQAASTGETL